MRNSKGRKFLTQSTSLAWIIVIVGQRGRGGRGREEGDEEGTLGFVS